MTEFVPEEPAQSIGSASAPPPPPGAQQLAPPPSPQQSMYAPPQEPAWAPPQSTWAPEPPKKRRAWPWILGIVGGLVVLGGAGVGVTLAVNGLLNADQNENYTGAPITPGDSPTLGDRLLVSDSGFVALELGATWVDANDYVDVTSAVGPLPNGATLVGTYFTDDPLAAVDVVPTLVMVLEGVPENQLGPVDLESAHEGFISGGLAGLNQMGTAATVSEPAPVTTANGLNGLVTELSLEMEGIAIRAYEYTFVRSERVVYVQVMAYTSTFDDVAAALATDSLRIDK